MKQQQEKPFLLETNEHNSIGKVIAVVSGKGGVGKSLITSMLAVLMSRKGKKVGIMDADITGPSIPKMFGLTKNAESNELGILPQKTKEGLEVISINLLLGQEDSPVIWRGPILCGAVKQFWTDVLWGDLDYLFVDLPPGTGDVPLTVFQSLPLSGIVIVTSPQDLVQLIVRKAYNMAQSMQIPVLGLVENMSYLSCPDCGKQIKIFGESNLDEVARELGLEVLGKLPLDPNLAQLCDKGQIESLNTAALDRAISAVEQAE
jgi:Mrp family chromosome partitioning ATPase